MTYNDLQKIANQKNISIKELAFQAEITRQGLQKAFERGSVTISLAKKISEILGISPLAFFVDNPFDALDNGMIVNKSEIQLLRDVIASKDLIIKMQNDRIESLANPHLMVADTKEIYKKR